MRVHGKPLVAGIVLAAAISMGIAGWAATNPPPPAPTVFLTPPAVGFSAGAVQCVATNASSVNITVVIQVINDAGRVDLDEPPMTISPFSTALIGDFVTAGSAVPDKCKFTTTSPQALRAGIIAADSNGLHPASFPAFPVTIVPPPTTTTVTQNQQ